MLQREVRQDDVEGFTGESVRRTAQVDDRELVEVGERRGRLVDVRADEAIDARSERPQCRNPAAAGIEHRDRARRSSLGGGDGTVERLVNQGSERRADPQPGQEGEAPSLSHAYQAVEVAASVMPWASSQRSASMAALQPSPAAVTAWR